MRIYPVDDFPFHQTPTPFNVLATSDPHFNDGYWFSFYAPGRYVVCGLRLHPNTNTMDGFVGLAHDGEQQCVRVSRPLRPDYQNLTVGPLRVELVEPMVRQRLVLGENPTGMDVDVTFEAQGPPFVEGRLDFPDGPSVKVVAVKHALRYEPGTKRVAGGTLSLGGADGSWRDYEIEAAGTPADVQGFAYYGGWKDGGSAGVYRGPDVLEYDRYASDPGADPTGPDHVPIRKRLGPTEYPCHMKGPDGAEGMAHVEHPVFGPYEPYSFS